LLLTAFMIIHINYVKPALIRRLITVEAPSLWRHLVRYSFCPP